MSESRGEPRREVNKGKWIGACIAVGTGIGIALGAIFDPGQLFFWGLLGVGSGAVVGVLISAILVSRRAESPGPPVT